MLKIQEKSKEFYNRGISKETRILLTIITGVYFINVFGFLWIILGLFGFPIPIDFGKFSCPAWGCGLIEVITKFFSIENLKFNWLLYSFFNFCISCKLCVILAEVVWSKETQNYPKFKELALFLAFLITIDLFFRIIAENFN